MGGHFSEEVRRCPTLPQGPPCSTIGAERLSFRVRNGTGRFPHAMTAVTLLPVPTRWGLVGRLCGYNIYHPLVGGWLWCCCIQLCWFRAVTTRVLWGLLVGNHIVDASRICMYLCGVSCWPISTGQLHESLVLASTSGLSTQWSGWGPLTHKVYGNLILKRASRLDAFSGYPIRT